MNKDFHHHFIPEVLKDYVADLPEWSVQSSLEYMDANGIEKAVLSLSNYELDIPSRSEYVDFCKAVNSELLAIVRENPGRFEGFALLPFPHIPECVGEIARCKAQGFAGFTLYSNVNGVYPAAPKHADLFKALDESGLPVFVHPAATPTDGGAWEKAYSEFVEYPQEVARLLSRWLCEDLFRAYPKLRIILSHGGGSYPFQYPRLGKLPYVKPVGDLLKLRWGRIIRDMKRKRTLIEDYTERMLFDLYDADAPGQLAALREIAREEQMVRGTNFPYLGA